jgi:hypothetical protein
MVQPTFVTFQSLEIVARLTLPLRVTPVCASPSSIRSGASCYRREVSFGLRPH